MEYRKLPHGGENISVLGMGASSVTERDEKTCEATYALAIEKGINYFDMAAADAACFKAFGRALQGVRDKVYLQVHFGADYSSGKYGFTTNLNTVKRSIDWQLKEMQTDYIDFGFVHCIDEQSDLKKYIKNGVLDYIKSLKDAGVVRHIGLSTHTPAIANAVLDMGLIDVMMFSINPAYDYSQGTYGIGRVDERAALYRRCVSEGVGISVMKAFAGGKLLNAKTSPFKAALTEYQCLQYALDKPGVLTVLPGMRDKDDLEYLLKFFDAPQEAKDYSVISTFAPQDAEGVCVYCNHCAPCPEGLDVGLMNKYYDLAKVGDTLAEEHYRTLEKKASDCIQCGHCEERCPFHVEQISRMEDIRNYFGE